MSEASIPAGWAAGGCRSPPRAPGPPGGRRVCSTPAWGTALHRGSSAPGRRDLCSRRVSITPLLPAGTSDLRYQDSCRVPVSHCGAPPACRALPRPAIGACGAVGVRPGARGLTGTAGSGPWDALPALLPRGWGTGHGTRGAPAPGGGWSRPGPASAAVWVSMASPGVLVVLRTTAKLIQRTGHRKLLRDSPRAFSRNLEER